MSIMPPPSKVPESQRGINIFNMLRYTVRCEQLGTITRSFLNLQTLPLPTILEILHTSHVKMLKKSTMIVDAGSLFSLLLIIERIVFSTYNWESERHFAPS